MWYIFFGYASFSLFFGMPLGMWHTSFGMDLLFYYFFVFIVHILDGYFREKESWYVIEFYFMGG